MRIVLVTAAVACLSVAARARGGDVRIDLRTTTTPAAAATQPAPATAPAVLAAAPPVPSTRPAAAGESAVSVLAVPGHDFAAAFRDAGRAVDVGGSVRALADGRFRVRLDFADRGGRGLTSFATILVVRPGEPVEVQGLRAAGGAACTTVLTLTPVAAAPH